MTVPPDWPNPRESQVSTLKPALRSGADADVAGRLVDVASGLVSREPPQPWVSRIVGARLPGFSPAAGWKVSDDLGAVEGRDDGVAGGGGGAAKPSEQAATASARDASGAFMRAMLARAIRRRAGSGAIAGERARSCGPAARCARVDADAVHQEREGHAAPPVRAAVAREGGDVVQRAGLGVAAVPRGGARACGWRACPLRPATASEAVEGAGVGLGPCPPGADDSRGVVRSRRREARAVDHRRARRRARPRCARTTAAPAAVVPAPPNSAPRSLIRVSAM